MNSSLLSSLNEKQKESVLYFDSPLLITAGAGSGKTKVLTHKIAFLIQEKGIKPENILALTFTNKAAKEMRERVESLTGIKTSSLWLSTFHAFGLKFLRKEVFPNKKIIVIDRNDQKSLLKEIIKRKNLNISKDRLKEVLNSFSNLKKKGFLINKREILVNFLSSELIELFLEYQKELTKRDALDFDDLISQTYVNLKKNQVLKEKYQNLFEYILVDEFQDTSPEQYKLLKELIKNGNITVVGDEDQSIYSWRGADMNIFLSFPEDFPGTKIIRLEENYRSTKIIINSASAVINENKNRIGKTLFTNNVVGDRILVYFGKTKEEEALFIANHIANNSENPDFFPVGVLYRINARSRAIEDALLRYGLSYKIVGGLSFYDRKVVKDITAYLKLAYNTEDDISFLRALSFPNRGFGKKTVEKIVEYAKREQLSYYESLKRLLKKKELKKQRGEDFINLIEFLKDNLNETVYFLLSTIVERTEYKKALTKKDDPFETQKENVNELLELADHFTGDVSDFISSLVLREQTEAISEKTKISLMTIHAAKGLEFNTVFLAGVEDGALPHFLSKEDKHLIEEERRLFYVAMTRAKKRLILTHVKENSPFIETIPYHYLYFIR